MQRIRAWRLEWPQATLALALCEVVEIVDEPQIHPIPLGPPWCRAVLWWRDRFIPLAGDDGTVVVVAYQLSPGTALQHAAFRVKTHPQQIEVDDTMDQPVQEDFVVPDAQLAVIDYRGEHIVIPDLVRLFAA